MLDSLFPLSLTPFLTAPSLLASAERHQNANYNSDGEIDGSLSQRLDVYAAGEGISGGFDRDDGYDLPHAFVGINSVEGIVTYVEYHVDRIW